MALTRTSTMENSDLEKTILRNSSIVPSYSEAMLMEVDGRPHHLAPNLLQDPPWGERRGATVRVSASSNLLGVAWRGAQGHVTDGVSAHASLGRARRMWSLRRCTGTGSFESSLAHALYLPPQGGRRKERIGKKNSTAHNDLRNENDLEMTSLVSTTTATAAKDTGTRTTMQEPSTSSVTQPSDVSLHPGSSPITSSTSSSSSYSSSSTSSSISSTESLPSYDTALNMAAIADTQCLITTRRNSTRTGILSAEATARSPRKRRPVAKNDDDSRDDADSMETASTYVSDQADTPRHQQSSASTIVPSRIQCRIVEDRETSL